MVLVYEKIGTVSLGVVAVMDSYQHRKFHGDLATSNQFQEANLVPELSDDRRAFINVLISNQKQT